jgi:hypothetical protein
VTVTGTANPSITYQWTKNNETQVGTDSQVLSFSPLRLSDAGRFTCQATVSPCSCTKMDTHDVTFQSEFYMISIIEGYIVDDGQIYSWHNII